MLADPLLKVDVFVTDVIMPSIDGPTWDRRALLVRPNTHVVFVSVYAEDAFGDEGPRNDKAIFLPKPLSLKVLTLTVQNQMEKLLNAPS